MQKILSTLLIFSATFANAEFKDNLNKYTTPIKLDTTAVQKILDQASKKDSYILTMIDLGNLKRITFIPEISEISDTDMKLRNSYSYKVVNGYANTTYEFGVQQSNCGSKYTKMAEASFNEKGELQAIISISPLNIKPENEPMCNFKGIYKFDPIRFAPLKMDTQQVDKLFSEANKAQKDVYSLRNSEKYKELVIRPILDNYEKSNSVVNVYKYKFENLSDKPPIYSLSVDSLECKNKQRYTMVMMFNKDGTFKKMTDVGPADLDYRHLEFCEKFNQFM